MEPATLTIEVTQDLIDDGCHESSNCPVAKAVMRAFFEWANTPNGKNGPIYAPDHESIGQLSIMVGRADLDILLFDYRECLGQARNYMFHHAGVTDQWVTRYDEAEITDGVSQIEPVTFELPITRELIDIRDAFRELYAKSDRAVALAPTD